MAERIMAEAPTGVAVAERAGQVVSPISGVSPELFKTLSQRHSVEFIKEQQAKYKTQEEFLADAEKEAEHIRFTLAKQEANATQILSPKPLSEGQEVNRKVVDKDVLENAQLWDTKRQEAAAKLLGKELSDQQKQELIEAHWESAGEEGQDEEHLAGVYNLTRRQISREARKLPSFTPEERRKLFEAGLVGYLTPAKYAALGIDPALFTGGSKLERVITNVENIGKKGRADEPFFANKIAQVRKLAEDAEIDIDQAQDLEVKLQTGLEQTDDKFKHYKDILSYKEFLHLQGLAAKEGGSEFSMARLAYEYSMTQPVPAHLRDKYRKEVQDLMDRAEQAGVLKDARRRALEFYKKFKIAKRHDKWGSDKQRTIDYGRREYDETFWDDSPEFKQLEAEFKGAAKYLYDGVVSEANKEFNADELMPSLNVVAKKEFHDIQEQRRRDRLSEKKYEVNNYYGRRSYELAAENAGELPGAILEWVRDQLAEIPDTDMQTVDGKLKEIRAEAEQLLGTNRVHLEKDEGQDVPETHPDFLRAKAAFEAVTDSIGYERIISWDEKIAYEGGGEVAASYAERYASGYIGHHDAAYLMRRVARILLKLRTHKGGTYWTGHPFSEEKVDVGYMREYRQGLQEEIIEDAATHDVFTETIFAENQDLFSELIKTPDDAEDVRLGYSGFFELREKYKLQYSHNDPLERLLLDPGDVIRHRIEATGDAEVLKRHDTRVKVFRDIKARRDAKDGLAGVTSEQRKNAIRAKINKKMDEKATDGYLAETTQDARDAMFAAIKTGDTVGYDKAMWQWVKAYNDYRIKQGLHVEGDANWYPTGWDMVRMKIDRAEKVLDRKLTDEQIDAMYEKTDFSGVDLSDYRIVRALDEARFGFQVARGNAMLEMEDVLYGGIRARIRDPKTGEPVDPDNKVRRVFDIVRERLKQAIGEEWDELEKAKADMGAEIEILKGQNKWQEAKEKQIELDKKILSAQFLAAHALRAAGFVDGELPVWDGQLKSDQVINFFGNILANYGVNVAFAKKISHNSKDWLYEIIERERRGWQSEWNIAAREYMVGTYPDVALDYDAGGHLVKQFNADGTPKLAEAYRPNTFGNPVGITERNRIVNTGAPAEHQGITDNRFNSSTSGNLAVHEFTDELGDLLFTPNMAKLGVVSIAGLHGYLKGRDEFEASQQKVFTAMDAVYSAKERTEAYKARKAFAGGKNEKGESSPGFANEPYHGGFKGADWLIEQQQLAAQLGLRNLDIYLKLMQNYRYQGKSYSEFLDWKENGKEQVMELKYATQKGGVESIKVPVKDLDKYRQLSYLDLDKLDKKTQDSLYQTMYGVYDYFQDYLKARKGCVQSRGGRTLRSWEEENHKALYAFIIEQREAIQGERKPNGEWKRKPEQGFILRLGYSPEVASEIVMRMMETVIMDADYLILTREEVQSRVRDGVAILSKVLTNQEKKDGWVIPDEKDWDSLAASKPEVVKALKNIRRRGLLEFMVMEGYTLLADENGIPMKDPNNSNINLGKKVLGQKIPPYAQQEMVKNDKIGRTVASATV